MSSDPSIWHPRTLQYYTGALPANQYDVRFVAGGMRTECRKWSRRQLIDSAAFLRAKNAQGYNIFARPIGPYVLVDDVCQDDLDAMRADNVHPSLIVETSPHNFQAWFCLGSRNQVIEPHIEKIAARMLAERYGGDLGSAKAGQLGRLPGSFNRKAMHERGDGSFPLVLIRQYKYRPQRGILQEAMQLAEQLAAARKNAAPEPAEPALDPFDGEPLEVVCNGKVVGVYSPVDRRTLYADYLKEKIDCGYSPPIRRDGSGLDRSQQDIDVVGKMANDGVPRETAAEALRHGSEKARERGERYLQAQIDAVWGAS